MSASTASMRGKHPDQEEPVVIGEGSDPQSREGLFQFGELGPKPGPGQSGESLGVPLPGSQRVEHRPARDTVDIAGDHRELRACQMVCVRGWS